MDESRTIFRERGVSQCAVLKHINKNFALRNFYDIAIEKIFLLKLATTVYSN